MAMTTVFKVGDIVAYKATFLRSCGWYTNVPRNGLITSVDKCGSLILCTVQWNDYFEDPMRVNAGNLILFSEIHRELA